MSALLMFFWLQLGRPQSNDANSDHGAGFFQTYLQSVFFTSATLRLRDFGRLMHPLSLGPSPN